MILDLITYGAFFLVTALSYGIICLGLNVQWGQTGLFNVGVAGFVAIGAYTSALLTTPDVVERFGGFGLPIWMGWIAAAFVSGLAAAFIGAITLRLRADYLAITTFGIAITIHLVVLNATPFTGGPFGIGFIPRPFGGLQERTVAFQSCQSFVGLRNYRRCLLCAGTINPWPVGTCAARHSRGRGGGHITRQECQCLSVAGFCPRKCCHGIRRGHSGAFHWLHRS